MIAVTDPLIDDGQKRADLLLETIVSNLDWVGCANGGGIGGVSGVGSDCACATSTWQELQDLPALPR